MYSALISRINHFFVQDEKFSLSSFSSLEHCLNNYDLARVWFRNWHSRKQILHGEIYGHLSCELTFHNCKLLWGSTHFQLHAKCLHLNAPLTLVSPKMSLSSHWSLLILLTSSWASKLQYLSSSLIFAFNLTFSQNTHSGDSSFVVSLTFNSCFQSPLPLTWLRYYFICK